MTTVIPPAVEELRSRMAELLASGRKTTTPLRVIRVAADLRVGDWLDLGDREVLVTHLVPNNREEMLEYGEVEVRSGTWWETYYANDPVKASPREAAAQAAAVSRG